MKQGAVHAALISCLILAEPGALAAQDIGFGHRAEVQSGVFAGGSVTIPLGQTRASRPRARLQLTTIHTSRDARSVSPSRSRPPSGGLELGLSRTGRANLYVGGQNSREMERRLGVNGGSSTWLIVGGVVVALVVVVALASSGGCLGPSMTDDC